MQRRRVILIAAPIAIVLLALISEPVTMLLLPYASRPIPAGCTSGSSHIPPDRVTTAPGLGTASLVTADPSAEVLFASNTALLVQLPSRAVLWEEPFTSGEISAVLASGAAYVFDDKLGYFLDASTGQALPNVIESDNYRGLFDAYGTPSVQTDMYYSALAHGAASVLYLHLSFAVIVGGCVIT